MNEDDLKRELSSLAPQHRVAFAASCAERLVPNYEAFCLMEKTGNAELVNEALEEVWDFLLGVPLRDGRIETLAKELTELAPDEDVFDSLFTSAAVDAISSTAYALGCCLDSDVQKLVWVSRAAIDTVYQYLYAVADPSPQGGELNAIFDEWVRRSPLMLAELDRQQRDLAELKRRKTLDGVFLRNLRTSSREAGLRPFDRGVIKRL